MAGATNATLVLSNVSTANAGNYFVRVSNSFGFIDSAPVMLTLKPLPTLNVTFGNSRVVLTWAEENGDFHVEATTNLVPPVMWQPASGSASVQDGKWTLVLPLDAIPQRYFRLVTP